MLADPFLCMFLLLFFALFYFFPICDGITCLHQKNYFNQGTAFGAPVHWSKYTTGATQHLKG